MSTHFVVPGDPNQCEGFGGGGQCRYPAEPGHKLCRACGGRDMIKAEAKRQYLLNDTRAAVRLAEFADDDRIKSLREEIALARVMCEKRFNLIQTDADLIASCGPVNQMLLTIEKLVKTCHAMEQDLGVLLSRQAVFKIVERLIEIVAEELVTIAGFETIADRVAQRLLGAVDAQVIEAEVVKSRV